MVIDKPVEIMYGREGVLAFKLQSTSIKLIHTVFLVLVVTSTLKIMYMSN